MVEIENINAKHLKQLEVQRASFYKQKIVFEDKLKLEFNNYENKCDEEKNKQIILLQNEILNIKLNAERKESKLKQQFQDENKRAEEIQEELNNYNDQLSSYYDRQLETQALQAVQNQNDRDNQLLEVIAKQKLEIE